MIELYYQYDSLPRLAEHPSFYDQTTYHSLPYKMVVKFHDKFFHLTFRSSRKNMFR